MNKYHLVIFSNNTVDLAFDYSSSLFVSDIKCSLSLYPTNMDRLSTTPTRRLICHAIFSQAGPPRRVDRLTPLW